MVAASKKNDMTSLLLLKIIYVLANLLVFIRALTICY